MSRRNSHIQTYTYGYRLKTIRAISTHDMVQLCKRLGEEFNNQFPNNTCSFQPEAISEGGIVFMGSALKGDAYKTMRLPPSSRNRWKFKIPKWPVIVPDQLTKWENTEAKELYPAGAELCTFLKAFRAAPRWTRKELQIFEKCFLEICIKRIGKYPRKKDLLFK